MKETIKRIQAELKRLAEIQSENKNAYKENQRARKYEHSLKNFDGTPGANAGFWADPADYSVYLTVLHIHYNRLRNRPPHTGSTVKDDMYVTGIIPEAWRAPGYYKEICSQFPVEAAVPA